MRDDGEAAPARRRDSPPLDLARGDLDHRAAPLADEVVMVTRFESFASTVYELMTP